jgi:molybdopterin-guanine dinucleotide biosynthesis adapter protein
VPRLPTDKVLGLAAYSGVGKTSLLKRLIPWLNGRGLRLGLVKLSHHAFEIDVPGKDSYELRQAGAAQVLLTSPHRWALISELPEPEEPDLAVMLGHLDLERLDLVLVEGFRHQAFPKIELHRPGLGRPLLCDGDAHVIAVATDGPIRPRRPLPLLDLNRPEEIGAFVLDWMASR